MPHRITQDCINCESVYVVTVVDSQNENPEYCVFCGASTVETQEIAIGDIDG